MQDESQVPVREPSRATHEWCRDVADRKIAGVCAGLSEELGVSVTVVRAAFILLALFHGVGIVLYLVLWFLMPVEGGRSGLDHVVDAVSRFASDPPRRPPAARSRRAPADDDFDESI
jgi:phage shock protein PspC (stress-responsive transcriptional regulator)